MTQPIDTAGRPKRLAMARGTERSGAPRWKARGTTCQQFIRIRARSLLDVVVHPVEGLSDSLLPVAEQTFALILVHLGFPALVLGPVVGDVILAFPETDSDASGVGGAQSGGFGDHGANHRHID